MAGRAIGIMHRGTDFVGTFGSGMITKRIDQTHPYMLMPVVLSNTNMHMPLMAMKRLFAPNKNTPPILEHGLKNPPKFLAKKDSPDKPLDNEFRNNQE